ncbi:MAG: integrase core domain-containing protein, partial [Solirubrobacterales bacterium]
FANVFEARAFCREFFGYYNEVHRHSGIGMLTPADVHYGRSGEVLAGRAQVLDAAYAANPERFVKHKPQPRAVPTEVWINKPAASCAANGKEAIAA